MSEHSKRHETGLRLIMASLAELEERIKALEEDYHPTAEWQRKLDDLESELSRLTEKLEQYGI